MIGTLTLGVFSTIFISRMTQRATLQHVQATARDEASKLNYLFDGVEKYTQEFVMGIYNQINQDSLFFTDKQHLAKHIDNIKNQVASTAHALVNAKSIYVRFNPKLTYQEAGIFLVKNDEPNSTFVPFQLTNISKYSSNDIEHVGWYYIPIQAGKPIWLPPYYNKNIDIYMISYVIPIFNGNEEMGIAGVDIDFDRLTKEIAKIRIMDTGYAYLEDSEGFIAYHPTLSSGLSFKLSEDFVKISEPLYNGMSLVCIVPQAEINKEKNRLIGQSFIFIFILLAFTTAISTFFAKSITKPLKKLTAEAKKVIKGDMNADFNIKLNDEIGDLAKSFAAAKFHIQQHMKQIQGLAFRDQLTGVRNKMAYDSYLAELESRIVSNEVTSYGIIVLDTNNLKEINDTYGHENGNAYLINSCKLICQIFTHSPIFRIGGDEFIFILTGIDLKNHESLLAKLKKSTELAKNASFPWKQVSIAYGISIAEKAKETTIQETFNKADANMYKHKRAIKTAEGKPPHRNNSGKNNPQNKA